MSDLIRGLLRTTPYRKGREYPDGRTSPFMLPSFATPGQTAGPPVEGVPPLEHDESDGAGFGRGLFEDREPAKRKAARPHTT